MSHWGQIIEPIFDSRQNVNNKKEKIMGIKTTCNDNKECLYYIYNNGKLIYEEINKFSNIPQSYYNKNVSLIFNTDNELKSTVLNDIYINKVKTKMMEKTGKNLKEEYIINHILYIIKPFISNNNFNDIDFGKLKRDIENTLEFKIYYMKDINTQLIFLLSDETINFIKEKIKLKISKNKIPTNEFIQTQLTHEINNFKGRRSDNSNKITTDNIKNIYTNKLSKLTDKNIFTIIYNTIAQIISIINIETNMIKNNSKLDKWDTILGDNNKHRIRQYSHIKINNRKPQGMMFNMNY